MVDQLLIQQVDQQVDQLVATIANNCYRSFVQRMIKTGKFFWAYVLHWVHKTSIYGFDCQLLSDWLVVAL
jgi:hypothetical protein